MLHQHSWWIAHIALQLSSAQRIELCPPRSPRSPGSILESSVSGALQARLGTPLQQDPICVFGPPELHRLVAGTAQLGGLQLTTPVVVVGWVLDPAKARRPQPVDAGSLLQVGSAHTVC